MHSGWLLMPAMAMNALFGSNVSAAPTLQKRLLSEDQRDHLQLLLFYERLQASLYTDAYNNMDDGAFKSVGLTREFRSRVGEIGQQDHAHVDTLAGILYANNETPLSGCQYHFTYSDPKEFSSLANMISNVGVGAYLSALTKFEDSDDILTTAASILSDQSRHDAYLRSAGLDADPTPSPFDTPLPASFVYTFAQAFAMNCDASLPFKLAQPLQYNGPPPNTNLSPPMAAGDVVSFTWNPDVFFASNTEGSKLYIAWINQVAPAKFTLVQQTGSGTGTTYIPEGLSGVAYAILSTFDGDMTSQQLADYGSLAGPAEILIG